MTFTKDKDASMQSRKRAITNAWIAFSATRHNLSTRRIQEMRIERGLLPKAKHPVSEYDQAVMVLGRVGYKALKQGSTPGTYLQRARAIFNKKHAQEAKQAKKAKTAHYNYAKFELQPPGRVQYRPMRYEGGYWVQQISPGDGHMYPVSRPDKHASEIAPLGPSPMRQVETVVEAEDEIEPPLRVRPDPDDFVIDEAIRHMLNMTYGC